MSCIPWFWSARRIVCLWIGGFATYFLLMEGSTLGLPQVTTDKWGGLSLVLFLFSSVVLLGMPMGLGLALMRRSRLPMLRLTASLLIDFIRSLPLLATLFTAAVVLPILLPNWLPGIRSGALPSPSLCSLPATINIVVVTFEETAVVIIIGFFDLRASASAAFGTGEWVAFYMETYLIVAFIYWAFITSLSRYGEYLKDTLRQEEH